MAQRTIHYLLGTLAAERLGIRDENRFLLGNVLPDAWSDISERNATHFIHKSDEGAYFDFAGFRESFPECGRGEALYLGYYAHLVTDALYRHFFRAERPVLPKRREDVPLLHNDYHILNKYIVEKYGISNDIAQPEDFGTEPINRLAAFCVEPFIEDMSRDFADETTGDLRFITAEILDEFIQRAEAELTKELECVLRGESYLVPGDLAWPRIK